MNLIFCMWVDIHRSNKLIQKFQMGVARHAQGIPQNDESAIF